MANNRRITQPPPSGFRTNNSAHLVSNRSTKSLKNRPKREFGSWEHNAWRRRRTIKYGPLTWESETTKLIDCYSRITPSMYQHNVQVAQWYKGYLNRLYPGHFDTRLIRPAHYWTETQLWTKQKTKKEERGTNGVKRKRTASSRTFRRRECKLRGNNSRYDGSVKLDRSNHVAKKERRSFPFQDRSPNLARSSHVFEKVKQVAAFHARSLERASVHDRKELEPAEKMEDGVEICLCGHWMEDSSLEEEDEEHAEKTEDEVETALCPESVRDFFLEEEEEWVDISNDEDIESMREVYDRLELMEEDDFVMI